jgi:hypothetical protein
VNIGEDFASPTTALDIETATVPCTMAGAVLRTVRLSLWAMWLVPLRREHALRDGQRTGKPEDRAANPQRTSELRAMPCDPTS